MRPPIPTTTPEIDGLIEFLDHQRIEAIAARDRLVAGDARSARSILNRIDGDAKYLNGLTSRAYASVKPGLFDEPRQATTPV